MIYLADLSGLIFLTAAGMVYATWKLYQEQEVPLEGANGVSNDSRREQDEVTTDPLQLS